MDSTTLGEKIMFIITAVLATVVSTAGISLYQEQKQVDQPVEEYVSQQESIETEVKNEMTNQSAQTNSGIYTLDDGVVIEITPAPNNGKISSPMSIKGTVSGTTSKARFTVRLTDPEGKALFNGSVSAGGGSGNSSANFNTNLKFDTQSSGVGSLEITKDGPGGDITIPVEF